MMQTNRLGSAGLGKQARLAEQLGERNSAQPSAELPSPHELLAKTRQLK